MREKADILDYFAILKNRETLGSAYLFIGDDFSLVESVLKTINCRDKKDFCDDCDDCRKIKDLSHPDLFIVKPEGATTKIDVIREINRFLSLKSFQALNKMVIVKDGLSLSTEAANAFLKTLEEPPDNSFIAICVSKVEGVLPTIISRCRKIFLPCANSIDISFEPENIINFLNGGRAEFKDRRKFSDFLWTFILFLRSILLSKSGYQKTGVEFYKHPGPWNAYSVEQVLRILKNVLNIYQARSNININLALELMKVEL